MAPESEAAALLQSGALYQLRLGLARPSGELIFLGFKQGAFSMYFGDSPIAHFDLEGRWQRSYFDDAHYLRNPDGSVVAIDRVRQGENLVLQRRILDDSEREAIDLRVRNLALELESELSQRNAIAPPPPAQTLEIESLRDFLATIARWDADAWAWDRQRYQALYDPIAFLPPECQQALVIQSERFGNDLDAFEQHVRGVAEWLGRRILQCRNVFLEGPTLARIPLAALEARVQVLSSILPIDAHATSNRPRSDRAEVEHRLDGIQLYLEDFNPPLLQRDDWNHLRSLHLRRISLGVASGDPDVRAVQAWTWTNEDFRGFVQELKAARLPLSLVILLGSGGRELAEAHEAQTLELLLSLPLEQTDFVYLIDADAMEGANHRRRLVARGLPPLPEADRQAQEARLKSGLNPLRAVRGIKVLPYRMEKQRV